MAKFWRLLGVLVLFANSALGYTPGLPLNSDNNLSDVQSAATARANLGLGPSNTVAFAGTQINPGLEGITFAPPVTPFPSQGSVYLRIPSSSLSNTVRDFGLAVSMTTATGNAGITNPADKVSVYSEIECQTGSTSCWALNTIFKAESGFFSGAANPTTAISIEANTNNFDRDVGTASPTPIALTNPYSGAFFASGASAPGSFLNTFAFAVYGGKYQFGFMAISPGLTEAVLYETTLATWGVDLQGNHAGGGAIRVGTNLFVVNNAGTITHSSGIVFDQPGNATPFVIYNDGAGSLTAQSGPTGFRWVNTTNNSNLMILSNAGVLQLPDLTTGSPAASLCVDAAMHVIMKNTTGSCT